MVRVVSCRYLRISCSEDDHPLFRRYYARSNRERSVKLLRCFPHCCPEHVQRCYCGSSVHVLVTFDAEVSAASQRNLLVCARFEPSRVIPPWPMNLINTSRIEENGVDIEHRLRPGEVVSLPETLLSTDNRKATQSVWIRADREGESKQTYKNGVLFVLNNYRFPKWLYSYDSSVTRTQREMTHHLVVYVCQLTGTRSQLGEIDAAVLARHESPGFSLISYRRSGNNGRDAGCDLPAIDVDSSTTFTAVDFDSLDAFSSSSDAMEVDSVDSTSTEPQTEKVYAAADRFQQRQVEQQQKQFDNRSAFPLCGDTEDKYSWQHRVEALNCGFREKGQHLLILWRFLQNISLRELQLTEAASTHLRSFWLQAAASFRSMDSSSFLHDAVGSLLRSIFDHNSATSIGSTDPECAVVRVTTHLFLRALSSHTVQRLVLSACTVNDAKTSKPHLQERFLLLISDVYEVLGRVLHEVTDAASFTRGNQHVTIPTLVDEVLSLVYRQPKYRPLRAGFVALLMDQRPDSLSDALNCAFQAFTALIRERMIACATRYRDRIRTGGNNSIWNHRWLLEPASVQLLDLSSGSRTDYRHEMRLVDAMQLMYELGCVDFKVQENASWISLRSAFSMATSAPMTLVLDGKLRVFRVLPSGISSMISTLGSWSIGDYTAAFSEDGRSLEVNIFSFADAMTNGFTSDDHHSRDAARDDIVKLRRVCLSIRLDKKLNQEGRDQKDLFVFVRGTVYGSTLSFSLNERKNGLNLSEQSAMDRAATWSEVEWAELWELKAGYIPLPRAS
ncbi:hypothetical protein PPTG_04518 [Phytophthora nicotianae INRA-310]|uniref:Uncharacterized protein n=2 Tax=Phytophthora nicotianae (strain INRA-310) TaxID=761204 RepID=W2R3M7_PHYN3|nr:hypothetical protein PPTG_04518 [Phytophthora nicotianae INRA-310]ETN19115.1 hypothetical protein PPTG_04518 [Phytophthora nicotianae INRA-310]